MGLYESIHQEVTSSNREDAMSVHGHKRRKDILTVLPGAGGGGGG